MGGALDCGSGQTEQPEQGESAEHTHDSDHLDTALHLTRLPHELAICHRFDVRSRQPDLIHPGLVFTVEHYGERVVGPVRAPEIDGALKSR